ncbi:MAG: archaemetzincin family Zn-dependent metalloprotease [Candidatus Eisenbacteria bacterium]|nr:archaemetzincin family Zn-dependent metalloprotease [Candidatus Eisenbacteria bacterium]
MPGRIRVLSAGGAGVPRLEGVARTVGAALGLPVSVERVQLDLAAAWDRSRGQHNSTALLAQVLDLDGAAGERRIAVVDVDLFIPVLTFVFGEAQLAGPAAVVSTVRLANPFYGLPRDDALLESRLAKEVLHELGHTLGLTHCRQFECVMRSSTYVEEIDLKRAAMCPACARTLAASPTSPT